MLFDHHQVEQLGLFWRHYPEIGLDRGCMYNLFLNDNVGLWEESLYPDEIHCGPWSNAFDRFIALGQVEVLTPSRAVEQTNAILDMPHLNVPDFADVFIYDHCFRNAIPFCISPRRAHDLTSITEIAGRYLDTGGTPFPDSTSTPTRNTIARWLIDIELPQLEVRSERHRKKLRESVPGLVAYSGDGSLNTDMTALLAASRLSTLDNSLFISPDELAELFSAKANISAVREQIAKLAADVASEAQVRDHVAMARATLDRRIGISNWVFAAINVGLSWEPSSRVVTTPLQLITNYFIRQRANWLLYLTDTNENLRSRSKDSGV